MNIRKISTLMLGLAGTAALAAVLVWCAGYFGSQRALQRLRQETPMAQLALVKNLEKDAKPWGIRVAWLSLETPGGITSRPRTFDLEGDKVYVDALVVKFLSRHVEAGDPWRGKSIALFYRIFGEYQTPANGYSLARVEERDWGYQVRDPVRFFEKRILGKFWRYAEQPTLAQRDGVDCVFGEAVMVKPRPLQLYTFSLAHNGGIVVRAEQSPWLGGSSLQGEVSG